MTTGRFARRGLRAVLLVLLALGLAGAAGCSPASGPGGGQEVTPGPGPPEGEEAARPLPVAVFLARADGLEAVFRSVNVLPEEAPRAALEALVAGPTSFEARQGFTPVLPPSCTVRGVTVADGVATADFSRELISDSGLVGGGSRAEVLALHAIYLTLAQFPDVERVKVLVEGSGDGQVDGRPVRDFWGHVGLPEYLTGPVATLRVPGRQEVGSAAAGAAGGLRLQGVRWWAHPALFRVTLTLEGGGGSLREVPLARASRSGNAVSLTVPGVAEAAVADLEPGDAVALNDWRADRLAWEREDPCTFRLTLRPERSYGWRLWGLTDPARIVLDVYATGPAAP